MRRYLSVIFLLGIGLLVNAQNIRVGLFQKELVRSFTFHCTKGAYKLSGSTIPVADVQPGNILFFTCRDNLILVNDGQKNLGLFEYLLLEESVPGCKGIVKPVSPAYKGYLTSGSFEISSSHSTIKLINVLGFDSYLSGVVEAEAGPGAPPEFFKVQAILARSYALKNWNNHSSEGFNLCDHTHCQAFHGISDENPDIYTQVLATHNIILTDPYSRLITLPYHSNSGGQTQRASDLWPGEHAHLQAIIDPFSENQRNASWTTGISLESWMSYLQSRGVDMKDLTPEQTLVKQVHRQKSLVIRSDTISLLTIRQDFGLKSSFFSMDIEGDSLQLKGRGYGHGVGLSQEGGMEMAKSGYSYSDILNYYYHMVKLLDLYDLPPSQVPAGFGN
jgi:stage II sporulation protein D